jgi:hypothetical protein
MARRPYALCGRSGRCAEHSPRKVGEMGVAWGPQTQNREEMSRRGGKLRVSIYSRVSSVPGNK